MKYNKFIKLNLFVAFMAAFGSIFTACDDDIKVAQIDEGNFETSKDVTGYIVDSEGKRGMDLVEFREQGSTMFYLGLSKGAVDNISATLKYDPSLLEAYNAAQESEYALFPQNLVTLDATLEIAKDSKKSNGAEVKFVTDESLEANKTYVIPVRAEITSGNAKLSEKESTFLIFVKDITKIPDCNKSTGIKVISCMEVNDTNPLNNLCFTLKSNGKPLVDMLIIFSANINYNNETGKVYVYNNPNVQHLLDNREKYFKPLQDRGMKVILGILGNHDRAGVANLADETARAFAQELKAVCDAYQLDGVFFDDEYTDNMYPAPPGFVDNSPAAASRLCYEVKQAMPDRLVTVYAYSTTYSLPAIDGHDSGTFVDYGIHDYGGSSDLSSNYPGMPKSGMALYSQEFSQGRTASESSLRRLRENGYGANMIFAMDPHRSNFSYSQLPAMERMAKVLYDDELVYDGKPYAKDW